MPGRQRSIQHLVASAVSRGTSARETMIAARRTLLSGESASQEALRIASERARHDAQGHQPPKAPAAGEATAGPEIDVKTVLGGRALTA